MKESRGKVREKVMKINLREREIIDLKVKLKMNFDELNTLQGFMKMGKEKYETIIVEHEKAISKPDGGAPGGPKKLQPKGSLSKKLQIQKMYKSMTNKTAGGKPGTEKFPGKGAFSSFKTRGKTEDQQRGERASMDKLQVSQ